MAALSLVSSVAGFLFLVIGTGGGVAVHEHAQGHVQQLQEHLHVDEDEVHEAVQEDVDVVES